MSKTGYIPEKKKKYACHCNTCSFFRLCPLSVYFFFLFISIINVLGDIASFILKDKFPSSGAGLLMLFSYLGIFTYCDEFKNKEEVSLKKG